MKEEIIKHLKQFSVCLFVAILILICWYVGLDYNKCHADIIGTTTTDIVPPKLYGTLTGATDWPKYVKVRLVPLDKLKRKN